MLLCCQYGTVKVKVIATQVPAEDRHVATIETAIIGHTGEQKTGKKGYLGSGNVAPSVNCFTLTLDQVYTSTNCT